MLCGTIQYECGKHMGTSIACNIVSPTNIVTVMSNIMYFITHYFINNSLHTR